jgi:hypothetical protein
VGNDELGAWKTSFCNSVETALIDLVTIGIRCVIGRQHYGPIPAVETIALR